MTDTPSRPCSRRRVKGFVRADVVVTDREPAGVVQPVHLASGRARAHDSVSSSRPHALALPSHEDSAKNA
jgi:hypothetical protein